MTLKDLVIALAKKQNITSRILVESGLTKQQAHGTIYYLKTIGQLEATGQKDGRYQVYQFKESFKGVSEPISQKFYRKILKAVLYCEGITAHRGTRHRVYAITFEQSPEPKRLVDLKEAIDDYSSKHSCHVVDEFGYDNRKEFRFTPEQVLSQPVFPEIEVDEE